MILIRLALTYGPMVFENALRAARQREAVVLLRFATSLIDAVVGIYLSIGMVQLSLKLARRQPAEIADLFGGGSRLLPTIAVSIVFGIIISIGLILCVIPGIIMLLMWWPVYYLVVDEKAEITESFAVAGAVTRGNRMTSFLLALVSFGIAFLGLLMCGIGIIFAAPLITMIWCVAYLMMSGQIPADKSAA